MDAAADPDCDAVVVMKSAQIGWTEIICNVAGYYIDQDPSPILVIQPTLEMGEAWSKDRLAPMLRDTPKLEGKVKDPRTRDSGNTILHKKFPGGHITIAGSNSPAGLASRPIRIVLCDEVDRYEASAGGEGDPVNLARKRSTAFWNRKFFAGSTPKIKGTSRIEALYESSDQRRYFVPCPDCGHPQHLIWENVRWPKDAPDQAEYMCEECGALWDDATRWRALAEGEWRATAEFKGTAGFHLNEIYSPFVTLAEMAANWIEAQKLPETLQTFINTSLGESWQIQGKTMEADPLLERREPYTANPVPDSVVLITAGVDVHEDRIEMEVVGWGRDEESWNLEYHVQRGDPGKLSFWLDDVDDLLKARYTTEDGRTLRIEAACVDSGYHTDTVYKFCGPRKRRRVWAVKGQAADKGYIPIWPRQASRTKKSRTPLFIVGVDAAKQRVYQHLNLDEPGPGHCHFPLERDQEYFDQLTAEVAVTKFTAGHKRIVWQRKTDGRPNEALDCRVYAVAARIGRNIDLNKRADALARRAKDDDADRTDDDAGAGQGGTDQDRPADDARRGRRFRTRRPGFVRGGRRGGFVKG